MAKTKLIIKPTFKTPEEKRDYLEQQLKSYNTKYGMDVAHTVDKEKKLERIPTGIAELDEKLGGGIPRGRFTVAWGEEKSGKTTTAYKLAATAQNLGLTVYFIALEPFDVERANLMGIDLDPNRLNKVIVAGFPKAEQCLDTITDLVRKELVDVVILDSIHSLSPKREQEEKSGEFKSLEKENMAILASRLSTWFKIVNDPVKRSKVAILLIGQTRTDIGGFIALEKLTGGSALKHYSKLRIHYRKGQNANAPKIKQKVIKIVMDEEDNEITKTVTEEKMIGFECVMKLEKVQVSGCAPEMTVFSLPYYFESGFDKPKEKEVVTVTEAIKLCEEVKEKAIEAINEITKTKKQRGRPKGKK